jgi:hypothetical protein
MPHYAGNRIEGEGQRHREMPETVGLDASCIAPIPASVGPARATSGPRRTYAGALGEPARAPKDAEERARALDQEAHEIRRGLAAPIEIRGRERQFLLVLAHHTVGIAVLPRLCCLLPNDRRTSGTRSFALVEYAQPGQVRVSRWQRSGAHRSPRRSMAPSRRQCIQIFTDAKARSDRRRAVRAARITGGNRVCRSPSEPLQRSRLNEA